MTRTMLLKEEAKYRAGTISPYQLATRALDGLERALINMMSRNYGNAEYEIKRASDFINILRDNLKKR